MSSLLQLNNELFSKKTRTWLRESVIDAELQHLELQFKMTR